MRRTLHHFLQFSEETSTKLASKLALFSFGKKLAGTNLPRKNWIATVFSSFPSGHFTIVWLLVFFLPCLPVCQSKKMNLHRFKFVITRKKSCTNFTCCWSVVIQSFANIFLHIAIYLCCLTAPFFYCPRNLKKKTDFFFSKRRKIVSFRPAEASKEFPRHVPVGKTRHVYNSLEVLFLSLCPLGASKI